jgi:RNA-directed DNA polymerase
MKRFGNLFDKITSTENLFFAAKKALRKKTSSLYCADFYFHQETHIFQLQKEIVEGVYRPQEYKIFTIYEPKERKICCSHVRDRVVHHAISKQIEPILDQSYIFHSYACRKNKGMHLALKNCQKIAKKYRYFLKLDIKKLFENVDHKILKGLLTKKFKDARLLQLLDVIIDHPVSIYQQGKGIPIGNLTSQHFANFYLHQLDLKVKHNLKTKGYIRYMDDMILMDDSKEKLWESFLEVKNFVEDVLYLTLNDKVTRLAPIYEGIPFLGFRVFPSLIRLQRANLVRMKKKILLREQWHTQGKISEEYLAKSVNGIISHIQHANTRNARFNMLREKIEA